MEGIGLETGIGLSGEKRIRKSKLNYKDKLQQKIMSSDYFKLSAPSTDSGNSCFSSVFQSTSLSTSSRLMPQSSRSTTIKSNKSTRPPVDYSKSKLSLLDNAFSDPTPLMGKRKVKAIKKKLRDRTKGPAWYGMTAPEITDDRRNDLDALKLRGALDTKTFYKRNVVTIKPKHFQVGKIVETKADFYNSRLTKKQRKRTIAEELMAELRN